MRLCECLVGEGQDLPVPVDLVATTIVHRFGLQLSRGAHDGEGRGRVLQKHRQGEDAIEVPAKPQARPRRV